MSAGMVYGTRMTVPYIRLIWSMVDIPIRVIILVDRSQPQMALSDTDSNRCPSGVNTTQYTHPSWPRKAPKTSEPVVESHMRIVSSVEPEATWLPSSENTTAKTLSV